MVLLPEVSQVPNTTSYVRGVINLRGRVLPLIDLRKRMGLKSLAEENREFSDMLEQREKDHHDWLLELENSVREKREFHLTSDPHKCAFGKWYDSYNAESTSIALQLKGFDEPHKEIHAVARRVRDLVAEGLYEQAHALIDATRAGTLARLTRLFSDLRGTVLQDIREIGLVVDSGAKTVAVSADSALSVEKLADGSIEPIAKGVAVAESGVVQRLGRRTKNQAIILLLETDLLMNDGPTVSFPI